MLKSIAEAHLTTEGLVFIDRTRAKLTDLKYEAPGPRYFIFSEFSFVGTHFCSKLDLKLCQHKVPD
jgi:hypothetical protein